MAGIDDIVALLAELRDSRGVLGRASVLARGAAAMRELTPTQRRELAVEVARRAAPQLVPRIEAGTGMDLTSDQVSAVMDLALRMDRDDIDDLIGSLSDDGTRAAVGREVLGAAGRELHDETGLDLLPPPELADGTDEATGREAEPEAVEAAPEETDDGIAALQDQLEERQRELAELERRSEELTGDSALVGAPDPDAAAAPEALAEDDPGEPDTSAQPIEVLATEPTGPEIRAEIGAEIGAETDAAPAVEHVLAPEADTQLERVHELTHAPAADPDSTADDEHDAVTVDADGIVAAIRRAASADAGAAGRALRVLTRNAEDLWHGDASTRRAAIGAVPDGWARRRAMERLVDAGVVPPEEAPDLLATLGRAGDRGWVAATMLADGLVDLDDVRPWLDERAATRLERRLTAP